MNTGGGKLEREAQQTDGRRAVVLGTVPNGRHTDCGNVDRGVDHSTPSGGSLLWRAPSRSRIPLPLLGKALGALSAKMKGCLAQSASPPRSLEPMLATFGTLPSETAGPSSRSGTASEPCPLSTEGESPSSAAEATTYAALSRRFRVPWNGHRTRCSRRGDRPFRNGERASRPSRA
jgi:hypothetical protein